MTRNNSPLPPEQQAARDDAVARARAAQAEFEAENAKMDQAATVAREKRRAIFAELSQQGMSLQDIGDAVGLHRARVSRILSGRT